MVVDQWSILWYILLTRKRESDAAEESAKRLKKLEDDKKKWEVSMNRALWIRINCARICIYHQHVLLSSKYETQNMFFAGVSRREGDDLERFPDEGREEEEEEAHARDLQTTQTKTWGEKLMQIILIYIFFMKCHTTQFKKFSWHCCRCKTWRYWC